ncbi:PAS domain-containing protein [Proteobacteria bacterium 005FR1]|nr:PAS domain-containing protein [Proteobacteria bacterium 005FR1]
MSEVKYIVGVGSSAGGLEALRSLFGSIEKTAGMSFVVVQHLAPSHKSRLTEILAHSTALKVREAKTGDRPEPNVIYVTPPNADIRFEEGALTLREPHVKVGPKPSVDVFFRSLAEHAGTAAIGVILSGTGSDGAQGVRAIKAAGGVTFAQTSVTAKYDGMPMAARYTGAVDLELSPEEIAAELLQLDASPRQTRSAYDSSEEDHFQSIFRILAREKGACFANYKVSTLRRRIERRMFATRCKSLEQYADYLRDHALESQELFQDILISVTSFFRDPEAFKCLEQHLEEKIRAKQSGESFRCWIIGCATGEEAYSIAILLNEVMERVNNPLNLQLFATDLDETALNFARAGCYSRGSFERFPQDLQDKYFIPAEDHLQVRPSLRDHIVFAKHNVAEDPPFLSTDLVTCRNVLIYFNSELQRTVFQAISYSLERGGVLFLGRSESVPAALGELFAVSDKEAKIFVSQKAKGTGPLPRPSALRSEPRPAASSAKGPGPQPSELDMFHSMVAGFAPDSVVVDRDHVVKHIYGRARDVLRFPDGALTYEVTKLLPGDMSLELSSLLYCADRDHCAARGRHHEWQHDGERSRLQMVVVPLKNNGGAARHLVAFQITEIPLKAGDATEDQQTTQTSERIEELEAELESTRGLLQSVLEQHETSDEEMQSLNEELQSANEELQSSNEELETTNEELQSTNEELTTLNQELNVKSAELQLLFSRHQAIQNAIVYPLLIVDSRMNILDFNPAARFLLRVQKSDIGAHLKTVPTRVDLKELTVAVGQALAEQQDRRFQFSSKERSFEVQVQLFHGNDSDIEGAVISFVDNTEISMALEETRTIKTRLSSIIDNTPAMITMKDLSGVYVFANNRFCEVTQTDADDVVGSDDEDLFGGDAAKAIRDKDFEVLKYNVPLQFEERYTINGEPRFWTSSKFVLVDAKNRPYSVCTISLDITERLNDQQVILSQQEELSKHGRYSALGEIAAGISHEINTPLNVITANTDILRYAVKNASLTDELVVKSAADIEKMAKGISGIVLGLKAVAGIDPENFENVPVQRIVRDAVKICGFRLQRSGVHLEVDLPADDVTVCCYPIQIMQVLINLINNALEAIAGMDERWIRVSLSDGKETVQILVTDSGAGIDPAMAEKIMTPFYSTKKGKGTGIGLSLSRSIARRHKGDLWVDHRSDNTVFCLEVSKTNE